MASTPGPSLMERVDNLKGEVGKNVSEFCTRVQTVKSNGVASFSASPAGKSFNSSVKMVGQSVSAIGRSVERLKNHSLAAVSSTVSAAVDDVQTLRRNVEKNVQFMTTRKLETTDSQLSPSLAAKESVLEEKGKDFTQLEAKHAEILAGGFTNYSGRAKGQDYDPVLPSSIGTDDALSNTRHGTRRWSRRPVSNLISCSSIAPNCISSETGSSNEEVLEEETHPDHTSVNATSVFSIGYVGPPLFGPSVAERAESSGVEFYSPPMETSLSYSSSPEPFLRLEDVRRTIGEVLVLFNHIKSLGFPESSWVNKMPWHNPAPARLAKGLQRPQQKFSSARARHEYHKRARRRGTYWIKGHLPGWSWFAADVIFLWCLIYNPAGKFLVSS